MAKAPAKKATEDKNKAARAAAPAHPSNPFADLRTEMDRLLDRFSGGFPSLSSRGSLFDWEPFRGASGSLGIAAPHVDVSETDKSYEISAELPGMTDKDINVELKDDVLTLSGEKKEESEKEEKNYHVSERRFGSFRRSFRLPPGVDQNKVSADFRNGVLKIAMPKPPAAQNKSRKIDVKAK